LPEIIEGDLEIISTPIDFLGINNYSRDLVKFDSDAPLNVCRIHPESSEYTSMRWEVYPEGLHDFISKSWKRIWN